MKKEVAIILSVFLFLFFSATAQNYKWVRGGGSATYSAASGYPNEAAKYMTTDPHGNVYMSNVVGGGTVYADTFSRRNYSISSGYNVLITSYNCSGQMRWAKLLGSRNTVEVFGITADSFGHVYIAGTFYNNGDTFHIGNDTFMSTGYVCAGTIQLDTNGDFKWIRFVGQNTFAGAAACLSNTGTTVLDKQQNLHCIRLFKSGAQLTSSITSVYGNYDLTYNAAGTLLSVKRIPALDSSYIITGASIDTTNNKLFVVGESNGLVGGLYSRPFIAAYDTARSQIWWDTLDSYVSSTSLPSRGFGSLTTDNIGHLYVTCGANRWVSYRGDTVFNTIAGGSQLAVVMKLDTTGNPIWMRGYSNSISVCNLMPIALLPGGKIASAGTMAGMVVGDHDTITSYAGEGQNSFFTILDTAGYVTHLEQIHGNAFYDYAISIASDRVGNLLIGGAVGDTTWAGGVGYRSHGGNTDFFVMKYGVQCGCTSMPVANFTVATSGVGGSTATFTYTGTTAGIDSMRWYFGDGTTSTTTSPSHTYSARGVFHAKVIVYTSCGNDIRATHITVPCVAAPTTAYSFSGTTATRSFTFTGTTIAVDSIVWNFGDGGRTTGSTASHSYTAIGSYTACVTVYTPCGSNSACHTVSVPCLGLPTPSFTSTGITATRNFTYTGSTTALDSVVWHYGDGGRSTGSTGAHTYASVGTYTVCVLAYTPCGVDSSCNTVTITCTTRPTAAFTNTGVTAVNFNYTGTTTGLDSVVWHYGDGGSGTGTTSSHTYATIGTFTACVLAYNHCGLDSTCHTVTVPCIAPLTASFTNTTPILGSYTDTFTYTGTTTALDSVAWYFGDGGHGTGATAAHTYAVPDTYTVCVYAYNPCGWDSACYTVIIPCDTPNAAFTYTHTNPVNFIYTGTTAHIDSVVWHFGDFTNGTGMTPTHGYPSTGTYLVCVYAYGVCAVDSFCDTVTVTGTGLAKPNLPAIRVYPNPVKNELVISDVFEPMDYRLMNIAGLTLVSGKLEPGNNNLPVKEYAPGIYLLEVTAGDGQRSRVKVVKD